jgi:dTDP-4-dehydrorhamnose 3,5-epimerase
MINGVIKKEISTHSDERGFFREIFRFKEEFKHIEVGQISHSQANKNVTKGWHGHTYQHQWNYILSGKAIVTLFDDRKNSQTYEKVDTFIIDNNISIFGYYFPPGVLHGYKCTHGPMNIIYVTSGTYDLNDEVRKNIEYKNLNNTFS